MCCMSKAAVRHYVVLYCKGPLEKFYIKFFYYYYYHYYLYVVK